MREMWRRWMPALGGLSLGLYVSRIVAEGRDAPSSLPTLLLLLLASSSVGVLAIRLADQQGLDHAPTLILLAYVLCPVVAPAAALSVAFVAVAALLITNMAAKPGDSWLPEGAVFALTLGLFVHTLAPTLLPADAGEFQLVSRVLGIAHPPGYPLYTVLGGLFTLLPVGDAAYGVNLLSAVVAALGVAIANRLVRRMTGSLWAGLAASIALIAAPTYWAQGTTANIRSLTAFFTVAQIYALWCYGQDREQKHLIAFAVAFGLGVTHHGSLGLLALPYGGYLLMVDAGLVRRWRAWVGPLLAFLGTLLVTLYLPIRSAMGAPFDPAPIRSLTGFLDHILARGFGGDMFAFLQVDALRDRLPVLADILGMQFGPLLLVGGLLGALGLLRRERDTLLLVGGVFVVNAFLAITYRAPQTVEYLMPAYMALAALVGYGVHMASSWRWQALNALVVAAFLWAGTANLLRAYPSYRQLSQDRSTREWAETLLRKAPPDALILANWHHATPLWYMQWVEGLRPDVDVEYVYPEGATPMGEVWSQRIAEGLEARPVLVTNDYAEFDVLPYRFFPFHGAQQVMAGALGQVPEGMKPLDVVFGERIRLCGYQVSASSLTSGDQIVLRLCWQPLEALDRDYSFFVHLVRDLGQAPLGQGDKTHPASRVQVGEIVIDEYRLPLLPTTPPGRYLLAAGVYFTIPGGWERLQVSTGGDMAPLTAITVDPQSQPPVTSHPLNLAFASGLTCVGVDYDQSVPGLLRVYLSWRGNPAAPGAYRVVLWRDGVEVGGADLRIGQEYAITAMDIPPGEGELRLEVRTPDGAKLSYLGPWYRSWRRNPLLPHWAPEERHVVLGGEIALKSATWETDGEGWQAGATGRVMLELQALRPLTRDYSVSVSLWGSDGRFLAQDDTTPALGAIPTLKWIRGTRIRDLHLLQVPPDAPEGEAILRLAIYDAFTLEPLAISDERLMREGQGTQMVLGSVSVRPK